LESIGQHFCDALLNYSGDNKEVRKVPLRLFLLPQFILLSQNIILHRVAVTVNMLIALIETYVVFLSLSVPEGT